MNTTTPAAWRRLTATVIGAGAIAIGLMAVGAPLAANAQPTEQSPARSECGSEDPDDVYTDGTNADGDRVETCCFDGLLSGVQHCDVWVNGKYRKDLSFKEQPVTPPPPTKPVVTGPGQVPAGSISPEEQTSSPPKGPLTPRPLPAPVRK